MTYDCSLVNFMNNLLKIKFFYFFLSSACAAANLATGTL